MHFQSTEFNSEIGSTNSTLAISDREKIENK
jgi:hypothetical protein